jgi:hypothetical protein
MSIFVMVTWKKYMKTDSLTGCERQVCGLSNNIPSKFWMKMEQFLEITTQTYSSMAV